MAPKGTPIGPWTAIETYNFHRYAKGDLAWTLGIAQKL